MSRLKSQEVADVVETSGATASGYARSPVSGANFIANIHRQELKFWVGKDAEAEVLPDKSHTQAVLNVVEPEREMTNHRLGTIYLDPTSKTAKDWDMDKLLKTATKDARRSNSIVSPVAGAKGSVEMLTDASQLEKNVLEAFGVKKKSDVLSEVYGRHVSFEVLDKMAVPESSMSLLVGIDEIAHFICALPKSANSVDDAHELLRPRNVKKGTPRQGEFFFKPVTDRILARLEKAFLEGRGLKWNEPLEMRGWVPSTHRGDLVLRSNGKSYVKGAIRDGREGRHEPLMLDTWHEVVRNREIEMPQQQTQSRTQYWD